MNRQGNEGNPRGGIEWTHIFGPRTGFTVNPVRGCTHDCKWIMPDGAIVICYAKSQKERMDGEGAFEQISFHPDVFSGIKSRKESCGIFIDSMSDLFGQGVPREWIDAVIQVMRDCPQHIFFSLTKNPARFREFTAVNKPWPENWLVGISAPPTFMFGKRLTPEQQQTMLKKWLQFLGESPARHRWISIEPLSFPVAGMIREYRTRYAPLGKDLCFAVIGAASNGSLTYQPTVPLLHFTLSALDDLGDTGLQAMAVFFKGNLHRDMAVHVAGRWRAEFPTIHKSQLEHA